jgi:diguanylate cyclase (GGDEF)-like protein
LALPFFHRSYQLIALLAGLAVVATLVAAFVVMQLIGAMSVGANQFDEDKTKQALHAAFDGLLDKQVGLVDDNARWDDAAEHSYGTPDLDWFWNTWGYSTSDKNYDAAFIVEANAATVVGYSDGKITRTPALDFIGPELLQQLSKFPDPNISAQPIARIIATQKGLAIVAVGEISYATDGHKIVDGGKFLVLSKTLTPDFVSALGERTIVSGLKLLATKPGAGASAILQHADGTPAAYLSWTADHPGDRLRDSTKGTAFAILAGIFTCIILFAALSAFFARRLTASEAQAWTTAHTDSLTGLSNRQATIEVLQVEIIRAPLDHQLVVMVMDVDGFKGVNDSYGHDIGDGLLQAIAAGLKKIGETFAIKVGRLGGDEFTIIFVAPDAAQKIPHLTDAVFAMMAEPFQVEGRVAHVGMSIGVCVANRKLKLASEFLRQGDVAMYVAKAQGKNRVVTFEPSMDEERIKRVGMAKMLSQALDEQKITVAYQPVVDSKSRRVVAVEALARWQISPGDYVSPELFISVAEEFGLIDRLGHTLLSIACNNAADWPKLRISFNISPKQFSNPNFVQSIVSIVFKSGIRPYNLELEITEGYLVQNRDKAKLIIEQLRKHGFSIALDDFGSGYSSIGYLREYKFDRLKIDKSLIRGMAFDQPSLSIIQATTVMAQSMNMQVTAEGVETEEEAVMLELVGCDSLQGYHFGYPQSATDIDNLLLRRNAQAHAVKNFETVI